MVSCMSEPDVGDEAPGFTLEGTEGRFTLSEHRGQRVVLLFYPGDDTTVCTAQFCAYRDGSEELAELGAVFVGISTQGMESKEAFKAKYGLTTPLLADPAALYRRRTASTPNRFGRRQRTVFIVDEEGKIAHATGNPMSLTFDGVDELSDALGNCPSPRAQLRISAQEVGGGAGGFAVACPSHPLVPLAGRTR